MKSEPTHAIVTWRQARDAGIDRYFTGQACKRGHYAERYTSSRQCVACNLTVYKPRATDIVTPEAKFEQITNANGDAARKALAWNVYRLRRERGWTQARAGRIARVYENAIPFIETMRANPHLDTLVRIAAAFRVTVADLFTPAPD